MFKPSPRVFLKGASLAAAALFMLNSPTVMAATARQPTCESLEKACLAHVERLRAFSAKAAGGPTEPIADTTDMLDDRCYNAFAQARQTGTWPSRKGGPSAPCSN